MPQHTHASLFKINHFIVIEKQFQESGLSMELHLGS